MAENTSCIIALFQPQAWKNDYAINIDGARKMDVTKKVLALSLDEIHGLRDDQYETDDLVEHDHDGPFYVEVVDAICEFFGVFSLKEITQDMLDKARVRIGSLSNRRGTRTAAKRKSNATV